jgi:hypothetical protein
MIDPANDNVYLIQARDLFGRASAMETSKDREQLIACAQVAVLICIAEELQRSNNMEFGSDSGGSHEPDKLPYGLKYTEK